MPSHKVFRWSELPKVPLLDGRLTRSGFRGDDSLLTFNWISPEMPRWAPHAHPFDQVLLTMSGQLMVELDGESVECGPGSLLHVPANVPHTGWPIGDAPVLNCDLFAPVRSDYLHLVKYQEEYPQSDERDKAADYPQAPAVAPFKGRLIEDASDVLFNWNTLPTEELLDGALIRAGFRGDHCLITFNWIKPEMKRPEPHSHPFDQIILGVSGRHVFEIDGIRTECEPGTIVRVPSNVMHTGWSVGGETAFNIDIFAPAREDYVYLTADQWSRSQRFWASRLKH